jgi:hypothetical protein
VNGFLGETTLWTMIKVLLNNLTVCEENAILSKLKAKKNNTLFDVQLFTCLFAKNNCRYENQQS